MHWRAIELFLLAAVALLGSPGPGIAAIVAVTRANGMRAGLRYLAGLQLGLAVTAGVTAGGLLALLLAYPVLLRASAIAAALYLVVLAWKIGTAPVQAADGPSPPVSPWSGFALGITNPKAYLAFASLMASARLVDADLAGDALLKWALCLAVALGVDLV